MCNMSYKREFCGLSEYVRLQNVRLIIKFTDVFKQDAADLAYADLKSNFKFRGCLRSIWPQKSNMSLFSFKFRISNEFIHFFGHFVIYLIFLRKKGLHSSL